MRQPKRLTWYPHRKDRIEQAILLAIAVWIAIGTAVMVWATWQAVGP